MCLFCCDMLCWFSLLTCCGCRNMVTRKLVYFPPKPSYEAIDDDTKLDEAEIYLKLQAEKEESSELRVDTNTMTKKKTFKTNETKENDDEMEALNTSDVDDGDIADGEDDNDNTDNLNTFDISKYGKFRLTEGDPRDLSEFYQTNYGLDIANFHVYYLPVGKSDYIPSYFIEHSPRAKYTILFSHGNAADIGLMRNHLCRIYQKCKCNIFAYEYTGYGLSTGAKPSEKNSYRDITAAYNYCTKKLNIKPSQLVAYGQSLGTCVSVHLASQNPVAGVVLHSPLMSGLRVMQPFDKTYWFDIYPVVEEIQQVFAPIFVIHGNRDREIDVIHGKILSKLAPNSYKPWFVPYAHHNDIEVMFPEDLFHRIREFLRYLKKLEKKQHLKSQDFDFMDEDNLIDNIIDLDTDNETTLHYKRKSSDVGKSEPNRTQSISPPPPSMMTNSNKLTLTHVRRSSNTILMGDEDSFMKTPSIATSLSNVSVNALNEKSTNKLTLNLNYDNVTAMTPTMHTIPSQEQSTSRNVFELAAGDNRDESQTLQTAQTVTISRNINRKNSNKNDRIIGRSGGGNKNRKKLLVPNDSGDNNKGVGVEYASNDKNSKKKWLKKRKKQNHKYQLILPNSSNMMENINLVHDRRNRNAIVQSDVSVSTDDDDDDDGDSSSDNQVGRSESDADDENDDDDDIQIVIPNKNK